MKLNIVIATNTIWQDSMTLLRELYTTQEEWRIIIYERRRGGFRRDNERNAGLA